MIEAEGHMLPYEQPDAFVQRSGSFSNKRSIAWAAAGTRLTSGYRSGGSSRPSSREKK